MTIKIVSLAEYPTFKYCKTHPLILSSFASSILQTAGCSATAEIHNQSAKLVDWELAKEGGKTKRKKNTFPHSISSDDAISQLHRGSQVCLIPRRRFLFKPFSAAGRHVIRERQANGGGAGWRPLANDLISVCFTLLLHKSTPRDG